MKLTSKQHAVIDYIVVGFLLISPTIFKLQSVTSIFTYVLAFVHLTLTLATNYEYGVFRFIPLKIHGVIELIVSIALVGVAFYLQGIDGEVSRNFYLGFAAAVFLTCLVTDYKSSGQN